MARRINRPVIAPSSSPHRACRCAIGAAAGIPTRDGADPLNEGRPVPPDAPLPQRGGRPVDAGALLSHDEDLRPAHHQQKYMRKAELQIRVGLEKVAVQCGVRDARQVVCIP